MSSEIAIGSDFHDSIQLRELLSEYVAGSSNFTLKQKTTGFREVDPTVLVALATGGSHVLVALVAGLLNVLQKRVSEPAKIVVRGSDGSTLEFPSSMTADRIEELLRVYERVSPTRIPGPIVEPRRRDQRRSPFTDEDRRIFRDRCIALVPQPAGYHVARSEILPRVLLTPPPSEDDQGGRYTAVSCAGAI